MTTSTTRAFQQKKSINIKHLLHSHCVSWTFLFLSLNLSLSLISHIIILIWSHPLLHHISHRHPPPATTLSPLYSHTWPSARWLDLRRDCLLLPEPTKLPPGLGPSPNFAFLFEREVEHVLDNFFLEKGSVSYLRRVHPYMHTVNLMTMFITKKWNFDLAKRRAR